MSQALKLTEPYLGLEIYRGEKIIYGLLNRPHLVLSTCRVNGGFKDDLRYVANHQACEPKPCSDKGHGKCLAVRDPEGYHRLVCEYHGLEPRKTALLGTAANMTLAGLVVEEFILPGVEESLRVFCVATAGVETNAGRAGDQAQVYEWEGRFLKIPAQEAQAPAIQNSPEGQGTINIMLFVNQELAPCALVRAVKMATEAKTAVLQELNVPSRYSQGLATGTGTDQIAVACLKTGRVPLRGAGKHVKLGELLARAVKKAVRKALARQNKLTSETIRYVPRLLERFGLGEEVFFHKMKDILSEPLYSWLYKNRFAVLSDTLLVSQVLAYVHLLDQAAWQVVPQETLSEALVPQAALVTAALSGKMDQLPVYYRALQDLVFDPQRLLLQAIALGFREKWNVPYYDPQA